MQHRRPRYVTQVMVCLDLGQSVLIEPLSCHILLDSSTQTSKTSHKELRTLADFGRSILTLDADRRSLTSRNPMIWKSTSFGMLSRHGGSRTARTLPPLQHSLPSAWVTRPALLCEEAGQAASCGRLGIIDMAAGWASATTGIAGLKGFPSSTGTKEPGSSEGGDKSDRRRVCEVSWSDDVATGFMMDQTPRRGRRRRAPRVGVSSRGVRPKDEISFSSLIRKSLDLGG
jgi:hypothetical protein